LRAFLAFQVDDSLKSRARIKAIQATGVK